MVLHLFIMMSFAKGDTMRSRYYSFFQWDSVWFASIMEDGYKSKVPPVPQDHPITSNVAFLPAYPVSARIIRFVSGMPVALSLLIAAQMATAVFWTYVLLFLRRWQVPFWLSVMTVITILSYPSSFFLLTAYSEPLQMASMLGFFYWMSAGLTRRNWILAAAHGIVMSSSRLVGAPLALLPLMYALFPDHKSGRMVTRWLSLATVSSLGIVAFLLFCKLRFGTFALYFESLRIGWYHETLPWSPFDARLYRMMMPSLPLHGVWELNRFVVPFSAVLIILASLVEVSRKAADRSRDILLRVCFILGAAACLYMPIAGYYTRGLNGLVRYTLPVFTLLVLAFVHQSLTRRWLRTVLLIILPIAAFCMLFWQTELVRGFSNGNWVA